MTSWPMIKGKFLHKFPHEEIEQFYLRLQVIITRQNLHEANCWLAQLSTREWKHDDHFFAESKILICILLKLIQIVSLEKPPSTIEN